MFEQQEDTQKVRKRLKVAFVSSCLPRRCGIATFTNSLSKALETELGRNAAVYVAMNNTQEGYHYPPEVVFQIQQDNLEDYRRAAEFLNASDVDLVSLQHEFGLFGGEDGIYITELLGNLNKPVVTTLHTVLTQPSSGQYRALLEINAFSQYLVVMNRLALSILKEIYDIPEGKMCLIYHGVPDIPYIDPVFYKSQLGFTEREIILTFGFLSPNKGIEIALQALPPVVKRRPQLLYIVLGITHPVVKEHSGEQYRRNLEKMVEDLGLKENVCFINEFVDDLTLGKYLGAADIVVCPYHSEEQITSGVLSNALGRGKPVISTPYHHAREALSGGRGRLVNFKDPDGITSALLELLENKEERLYVAAQAYALGKEMSWSKVGRQYVELFEHTVDEASRKKIFLRQGFVHTLPPVNLEFMKALTDNTGIIQHTSYGVPVRSYGYSADDCARALVVCVQFHNLFRDDSVVPLINKYLSFILHARREDGWFANFMNYRQKFKDKEISQDTFGRCLWGLGAAIGLCHIEGHSKLARDLFDRSLFLLEKLTSPRAAAYSALGLDLYLEQHPDQGEAREGLRFVAEMLLSLYRKNAEGKWRWFETYLTYDNARLPQALLFAYRHLGVEEYKQVALEALDFYTRIVYHDGYIDLIGNRGWYCRGGKRAVFDQQPLDAGALVETYLLAFLLSGKEEYLDLSYAAFQWFLGRNRLGISLYFPESGSVADGLSEDGLNGNKGAESTLAFLLALLSLYRWELQERFNNRYLLNKASNIEAVSADLEEENSPTRF